MDPSECDKQRDEPERQFPGWRIWAVPYGNPTTTHVTWCAQPEPLINCSSPEALAEAIRSAPLVPPYGSPSLASWRSYRTRLRQLREFEERAGERGGKCGAEADRWRRFPKVHRSRLGEREPGTGVTLDPGRESPGLPDTIA